MNRILTRLVLLAAAAAPISVAVAASPGGPPAQLVAQAAIENAPLAMPPPPAPALPEVTAAALAPELASPAAESAPPTRLSAEPEAISSPAEPAVADAPAVEDEVPPSTPPAAEAPAPTLCEQARPGALCPGDRPQPTDGVVHTNYYNTDESGIYCPPDGASWQNTIWIVTLGAPEVWPVPGVDCDPSLPLVLLDQPGWPLEGPTPES